MTAARWEAENLAELLSVDLGAHGPRSAPASGGDRGPADIEPEPLPDILPRWVRDALDNPDIEDRSKAIARLVAACHDSHLTIGQTLTVCAGYGPAADKHRTDDRLAGDVERLWLKIAADRSDREDDRPAQKADASAPARALRFQWFDDLAAEVDNAPEPQYLIRNVWPHGDYGMLSAAPKAQKTWTALDLAVSVATGTAWLGYQPVDVTGPVIVFVGEGGKRNTVRRIRAIARSRGVDPAGLKILVCARAPHLTVAQHLAEMDETVQEVGPALVIIDPLYLAARGADLKDLYAMGAVLENVQVIAQRHGASLMLVHHFNRDKTSSGAARNSGAGPQEWARVLLSLDVVSRKAGSLPGETVVVTKLDAQGGEIPDQYFTITRRVWADDPGSLSSPMHVAISVTEDESETVDTDQGQVKLSPAAVKLLEALADLGRPGSALEMGDRIAVRHGNSLRRETISKTLNLLRERGLVDHHEHEVGQREGKLWFLTEQGKNWHNRRSEPVTTCDQAISADDLHGPIGSEVHNRRSEPVTGVTSHVTVSPEQTTCDRVTAPLYRAVTPSQVTPTASGTPVCAGTELGRCERCRQPADRLIAGRCVQCAYPAGDSPEDEEQSA